MDGTVWCRGPPSAPAWWWDQRAGGSAGGRLEERCVWVSNFRFSVFDPRCYDSLTAIFCSFFIIRWASFSIFFLCCSM